MDASTISRLVKTSPLLGGLGKLMNLYEATGSVKDFVSNEELDKTIGLSRITLGKLISSYMEISEVIIAPYKTADNQKGYLGLKRKDVQHSSEDKVDLNNFTVVSEIDISKLKEVVKGESILTNGIIRNLYLYSHIPIDNATMMNNPDRFNGKTMEYDGHLICYKDGRMSKLDDNATQEIKNVWNKVKDGLL